MNAPAPLSSHPTPFEPFFDGLLNGDTVVQTRRCASAKLQAADAYPTPHIPFFPPKSFQTKPDALVGRTLGDYELIAYHGRGGVGAIYKARQKSRNRMVAVKVLHAKHVDDEVCVARFLNEARAAAELKHPNIIRVHQVGEYENGYYYAMEFIDGPSLEIALREGDLGLLWIVNTMIRLAETIQYAHSRGIVHRDLKPANVLLDGSDHPVVIDFGLVKYLDAPAGLTRQGEVLGTPAYMAPEQAGEEPDAVGPAADIYSLGAILYTLLTKRVPFDAGSSLSTILKVVGPELPPPVRELAPEVPEVLEAICMRCLSKLPCERFESAEALAEALREARDAMVQGDI